MSRRSTRASAKVSGPQPTPPHASPAKEKTSEMNMDTEQSSNAYFIPNTPPPLPQYITPSYKPISPTTPPIYNLTSPQSRRSISKSKPNIPTSPRSRRSISKSYIPTSPPYDPDNSSYSPRPYSVIDKPVFRPRSPPLPPPPPPPPPVDFQYGTHNPRFPQPPQQPRNYAPRRQQRHNGGGDNIRHQLKWMIDFMMLIPSEQWERNGICPPMAFGELDRYLDTYCPPRQTQLFGGGWVRDMLYTFPLDFWHHRRLHPPIPFSEMQTYNNRFKHINVPRHGH
jgi:hypothetical protein